MIPAVLWTILLASLTAPAGVHAKLLVSPPAIRANFDEGRPSGTIVLTNAGETAERYRARAAHFQFSENGELMFVRPDARSLVPWIRFNPTEFEMPPNSRRVVRYTVLAPPNLQPGEYWGGIEFEPLEPTISEVTNETGSTTRIKVLTATLVMILGQTGDLTHGLETLDARTREEEGGRFVEWRVKNSGNAKMEFSGEYEVISATEEVVARGEVPERHLFPESVQALRIPIEDGAAPQAIRLRLESPQMDNVLRASLPVHLD